MGYGKEMERNIVQLVEEAQRPNIVADFTGVIVAPHYSLSHRIRFFSLPDRIIASRLDLWLTG